MKLYIKQKVFSLGDRFRIFDVYQNDRYYAEGEIFTLGKKLSLCDMNGNRKSFIQQKVFSFLPKFFITANGGAAEVTRKFTLFRQEYAVNGPGWTVTGDFFAHEYRIEKYGGTVAVISKRWLSWGDTYEIVIAEGEDEVMVLSVVLVIDAALAASNSHSSHIHSSSR